MQMDTLKNHGMTYIVKHTHSFEKISDSFLIIMCMNNEYKNIYDSNILTC